MKSNQTQTPHRSLDAIRPEGMPGGIRVREQSIRPNGWVLGAIPASAMMR